MRIQQIDEVKKRHLFKNSGLKFGVLGNVRSGKSWCTNAGKVLGRLFVIQKFGAGYAQELYANTQYAHPTVLSLTYFGHIASLWLSIALASLLIAQGRSLATRMKPAEF
jgi:hypothetical protein